MLMIPDWQAIFGPDIPVLETLVRGTIMYFALLLLMRLSKREAGELGLADVLVIVVLADAAQNGLAGEYNSITNGLVLVCTIIFWDYVIDWVTYHFPVFDRFMRPQTICLVKNGQVQTKGLQHEMITVTELREQLRLAGVNKLRDVKRAYMEPNGKVSVIKYND